LSSTLVHDDPLCPQFTLLYGLQLYQLIVNNSAYLDSADDYIQPRP